jgi:hypothetical protein
MTLDEFVKTAVDFANQKIGTLDVNPERLNRFLKLTNYDYFKLWCGPPEGWQPGQPITARGWQVAAQNTEALRTFLSDFQNYSVPNTGKLNYPSGFVHITRLAYYNSTSFVPVEMVTDAQVDDRLRNPITAPELAYPIYNYGSTYLQIYPINIGAVSMSFLRLPVTPVYALKELNGINVYDSVNSVQFEWPEAYHNDLLRIFLTYLGIGAKDASLFNYAEMVKEKGT